jgi:hypothetical protein
MKIMKNLILSMALILIVGIHDLQAQGAKIGIFHIDAVFQKSTKGKAFINKNQGLRKKNGSNTINCIKITNKKKRITRQNPLALMRNVEWNSLTN